VAITPVINAQRPSQFINFIKTPPRLICLATISGLMPLFIKRNK
jgi:hypothetical protein